MSLQAKSPSSRTNDSRSQPKKLGAALTSNREKVGDPMRIALACLIVLSTSFAQAASRDLPALADSFVGNLEPLQSPTQKQQAVQAPVQKFKQVPVQKPVQAPMQKSAVQKSSPAQKSSKQAKTKRIGPVRGFLMGTSEMLAGMSDRRIQARAARAEQMEQRQRQRQKQCGSGCGV